MPFRNALSASGDPVSAVSPDSPASAASAERRLVVLPEHASPRVSVVVPARNEAANLPYVLSALPDVYEVILVDGGSTDGTVEVARELLPTIRVVAQTRRGKGNALACGFAHVRGDIVVMLDADGSADPAEIPRYVSALLDGADFAKGTRFAVGGGSSDLTRLRSWGNHGLNLVVNVLFGTRYTDLCYGYNAFWTRCLPVLSLDPGTAREDRKLWGDGFEIETIINTRIAMGRLRVVEVPSFELERIHGESNLNTWRDGFRVLRAAVTERFRRRPASVRPPRSVSPLPAAERERSAASA
ncbi:MAG: glycosyl transferase family 2 [Frankiales bacterium]|nr:glycosyl transferase family 2 [Frankiales bacterium]